MSEPGPATAPEIAPDTAAERPPGVPILVALGLGWLGATLWAGYRTLAGAPDNTSIAVVQAAIALPTAVVASVLAGTASGLLILTLLARRRREPPRAAVAAAAGMAGGLLVGGATAGAVLLAYGSGPFVVTIAATVGVSAILGAAMCAVRPATTVAAGLVGGLACLAVGLVKGAFAGHLPGLFGAGGTAASQLTADSRLQLTVSALAGIAAGLAAFWYLRRSRVALRWPAYLVAGGTAGALLLAAELAVRLGGASLLAAAESASAVDQVVLGYLGSQRINHALLVFFVGAITAMLAVGRTLPARSSPPNETSDESVKL